MKHRLLTLMLAFAATTSLAQSPGTIDGSNAVFDDSDLRRYTVELIVFEYAQSVGTGTEVFVPEKDDLMLTELRVRPRQMGKSERVRLSSDQLTMRDTFRRMQRLDVYRPIMHFGWTQTLLPDAQILESPLRSYGRAPAGLDGEIRLYLSRYLHLDIDLTLAAETAPNANSFTANSDVAYRINEDRIVRDGELRYFDHPKFGVLAKVTKIEMQAPNTQEETEFLGDG